LYSGCLKRSIVDCREEEWRADWMAARYGVVYGIGCPETNISSTHGEDRGHT
jgi:hypothetical protein